MAGELAPLQRVLAASGIAVDTDDAADALLLLRSISEEVRKITHRQYEGIPTIYDELIDTGYEADFILPHVPVTDLLSLAAEAWDGTQDDIWTPEPVEEGWSTLLSTAIAIGDLNAKVDDVNGILAGEHMELVTGQVVRITTVGTAGAGGTGLDFEPAAQAVYALGAAVQEVAGSTYWRLLSGDLGHVQMIGRRSFIRAIWRVSGNIPAYVEQGVVDWHRARWSERTRTPGQTAYSTGDDSESWDATMAGTPPPEVVRSLGRDWHPTKNGVI